MMDEDEFTKFMNDLRKEYGLPPKLAKPILRASRDEPMVLPEEAEPADYEDVLSEDDVTSLQQEDDSSA